MMLESMTDALLGAGLALLVGAAFAALLAGGRILGGLRSAGVAGGIVAGVMLGPGVLGGAASDLHERLYLGGAEQRRAMEQLERRQAADIAALRASDVTQIAIDEQIAEHVRQRAPLEMDLAETRDLHTGALGALAAAGLIAGLLCCGLASPRRRGTAPDGDGDIALGAGLSSVVVASLSCAGLALWLTSAGVRESLAFGAAGGVGGAALGGRLLLAPAGRARRVGHSALVAVLTGGALVAGAGRGGVLATALLIGAALSIAAPMLVAPGPRGRRRFEGAAFLLCAPPVVSLALVRADPSALAADGTFWIGALICVVCSHDGRWIGAWIPWRLFGAGAARAQAWRRSGAILDSGVGLTQAGAAALLLHTGALPQALAAGVIIAALVIELAAPLRSAAAKWMDRGFGFSSIEEGM